MWYCRTIHVYSYILVDVYLHVAVELLIYLDIIYMYSMLVHIHVHTCMYRCGESGGEHFLEYLGMHKDIELCIAVLNNAVCILPLYQRRSDMHVYMT